MKIFTLFILVSMTAVSLYYFTRADSASFEISDAYTPDPDNGEVMTAAAGCLSCHSTSPERPARLGGNVKIASPFGDIIGPNISPHQKAGIGSWTQDEFLNAVKRGVSPDGTHYYPAFPYSHFAGLSDEDVLDIQSYLKTLPPVSDEADQTELPFPFNLRRGVGLWKRIELHSGKKRSISEMDRGEYLVEHAAHCGACHTPRNIWLGLDTSRAFQGAELFDGSIAPPITPARLKAAGPDAFVNGTLAFGLRLDGTSIEYPEMLAVVNEIRMLSEEDRMAIFDYLISREDNEPDKD